MEISKFRRRFLDLLPVTAQNALKSYRTRLRVPNPLGREFTLPEKSIEEIFQTTLPPTVAMAGVYIEEASRMSSPIYELFVISAISALLKPQTVFEIGTYLGASALMIAKNIPEESKVFTLDLPPEKLSDNNIMNPDNVASPYQVGELLREEDVDSQKVQQLYGDSTRFDYSPYKDKIDLIFIDGNHEYDYVKTDSLNAFEMLRPGGCIIWDDYYWDYGAFWCSGVTQYLNELARERKIFRIAGTRLGVFYDGGLDKKTLKA